MRAGPGVGWGAPGTVRHAAVHVRVGGRWRKGQITKWVTDRGSGGWECVIAADEPSDSPPWQGRYVYDPRAIRPRHDYTPPE
jgi:hypothetical protein